MSNDDRTPQLLVISAPSGAGKTTIAHYLLQKYPFLQFSVSATTRPRRKNEVNGRDYYFLSEEEFKKLIDEGKLLEYEQIFGYYYGTLRSTVEEALRKGQVLVFDVDVKGALSIKNAYPEKALLVFVIPPDLQTLEERLRKRGTENDQELQKRLERAKEELSYKKYFDEIIVNDTLPNAYKQVDAIMQKYFHHLLRSVQSHEPER